MNYKAHNQVFAIIHILFNSDRQFESLSLFLSLSLLIPIVGAIVGLDQSSYEVNEEDGMFPVCVILYNGVLASSVTLDVRSRRGGTAGMSGRY